VCTTTRRLGRHAQREMLGILRRDAGCQAHGASGLPARLLATKVRRRARLDLPWRGGKCAKFRSIPSQGRKRHHQHQQRCVRTASRAHKTDPTQAWSEVPQPSNTVGSKPPKQPAALPLLQHPGRLIEDSFYNDVPSTERSDSILCGLARAAIFRTATAVHTWKGQRLIAGSSGVLVGCRGVRAEFTSPHVAQKALFAQEMQG